jgi:tryptophan synthase alpha chain
MSAKESRLTQAFREAGHPLVIPYAVGGYPDAASCARILRAYAEAGAGIMEIGVPFSDPLADGLTNQLAAQRALAAGMTSDRVFELVRALRVDHPYTPIIFYTYYNLVFANGVDAYVHAAKAAGVDGMLTLDLPPEEAGDLLAASRAHDLKTVFIVAPTTSDCRLPKITAAATGFVYYVSREGVTGVRDEMAGGIPEAVARIKAHTALPVVVGFGLSSRDQVSQVARWADGVVVGSALVNCIKENLGDTGRIVARLRAVAADLAAGTARLSLR